MADITQREKERKGERETERERERERDGWIYDTAEQDALTR